MICDRRCVVLLLWTLCNGVDSSMTERPNDTEVRVGDSTYLNCSFSDASAPKSWYHYPVGKGTNDLKYVFTNDQLYAPYDERFRIDTTSSYGAFNLVMNQVGSQDAGRYVCRNAGEPATAQLIVLESTPHCMTNINSNGVIGPNNCGLEKETIHLSCGVSYSSNIPPKLQWTRVKNGKSFPINDSLLSCLPSVGRITCNYAVEADIELDGSHFVCQTRRAANSQYNCSTEYVKILYLIENKTKIAKTVGDEVSCPTANTSSSDCSYTWIWYDGDIEEAISNSTSLIIGREGLHRCEARCTINDFVCRVSTTLIKASATSAALTAKTTTGLITGCIILGVLFSCLCAFVVIRMIHRKTARRKIVREQFVLTKLLKTEDQHRQNIEALEAKLKAKNNEVDDLAAVIKVKNEEIEELHIQVDEAKWPNKPRLTPKSDNIEAMWTSSDDQPSTSNDCDDQTEWKCTKCTFKGTGQNCKMCGQPRESQ